MHHRRQTAPVILIIENDPGNRFLLEKILSMAGYGYRSVGNGQEALDLLDRETVSLILTDVSMPVLDGYSMTRQIREKPGYGMTPIIAVTAHAFGNEREQALLMGCTDLIVKPYRPRELLDRVAQYLPKLEKKSER